MMFDALFLFVVPTRRPIIVGKRSDVVWQRNGNGGRVSPCTLVAGRTCQGQCSVMIIKRQAASGSSIVLFGSRLSFCFVLSAVGCIGIGTNYRYEL